MVFRRGLESREAEIAREVFGDALDISALRLAEGGLLGSFGVARTLPRLVTFPKGVLTSPQNQARYERWLVHELTHAYQYQHGRSVLALLPTALAGFFNKSLYDYGGPEGLRGKTFADFNTEQQANIVADYYYLSTYEPHRDLSAYEPYIAFVRQGRA
ncbi:hypothetical protein SAMN05216188_102428 [Lentzea xinjiangensis]|uniref:DUF4157 domain-containing protein n=1 Tax=Lentzea xinjiangensis TaxID=402600 RepID=A0A1H9E6W1_9PSEU|nr:hypothetical protein [Lentzea xinjiangensis]SEQ21460.1 hypothetical protein SAMN05216188_102428 [Lentzea xinjiangensis]